MRRTADQMQLPQLAAPIPASSPAPDQPSLMNVQERSRPTPGHIPTLVLCSVTITWKNLWVFVPNPNGGSRPLLHNLTGCAEACEVMAIMGPSGSGKSTLLDSLVGRLSPKAKLMGEVLINGTSQSLSYGSSAYVTQDDVLMATLTVREAVYYSAELQLPGSMPIHEKKERADTAIREMGLQAAINTRIGGWRAKGLSGGEKRRLSITIELLTRPHLLFLDEPTSGLDSAAAFHVFSRLRQLAIEGRTIITSVHQPSSDVFELFTSLYLLSGGRTVYFGDASGAKEFFALNGFSCPPNRNPSDHYLRTINKDFELDVMDNIEGGDVGVKTNTEQVVEILVNAYNMSDIARAIEKRVNVMSKMEGAPLQVVFDRASLFTQVNVLTRRSFINMYRDPSYYWLRLVVYIALSICLGTVFYKVGHTYSSIQARSAMLMYESTLLTLMSIGGFPAFVEEMRVFYNERINGHYGVASFVIANTLSSSPYLLLLSILPATISYFLADLHHGFDHFAYYVLSLYASVLVVESLMMVVSSIVPDFLLGIIAGAGIQGLFVLTGGFFRLPGELPKPIWKYPLSYMAYHTYSFQGLLKNEFEGLMFPNNNMLHGKRETISGDSIIRNSFEVTMSYSKWVDLIILLGMAILYRMLFFVLIKFNEKLPSIVHMRCSGKTAQEVMFVAPTATDQSPFRPQRV